MEEHLAAFRQLRTNTGGLAMALGYMIAITTWMGDFKAAEQFIAEKREIERSFHNDQSTIGALLYDSGLKFAQGLPTDARGDLESALVAARKNTDDLLTCRLLENLGNTLVFEGHASEGRIYLKESLEIARKKGALVPFLVPDILIEYADAVLLQGDPNEAEIHYRKSLTDVRYSIPRIMSRLEGLAKTAASLDHPLRAAKLLGAAQQLREKMSLPVLPVYQAAYDQVLTNLRKVISETAYQQAWETGAAMTATDCVDFALGVE